MDYGYFSTKPYQNLKCIHKYVSAYYRSKFWNLNIHNIQLILQNHKFKVPEN